MSQDQPIRNLTCCVCGEGTRGRQWHNRDTGFGVCKKCVEWVKSRGETDANVHSYYGVEGVHYNIEEGSKQVFDQPHITTQRELS